MPRLERRSRLIARLSWHPIAQERARLNQEKTKPSTPEQTLQPGVPHSLSNKPTTL